MHRKLSWLLSFPFVSAMAIMTDTSSSCSYSLLCCLPHALAVSLSAFHYLFRLSIPLWQHSQNKRLPLHLSSFEVELNFALLARRKLDLSSSSSLFYLNHPEHNCNLFPKFIKALYNQKLFTKCFHYAFSSEENEVNAGMFASKTPVGIFLLYLESPLGGAAGPINQLYI